MTIDVYTDGGCAGNPGPGAWAYVGVLDGQRRRNSGFEAQTTNNRMELTAVITALRELSALGLVSEIRIYTDSQYVQKGITEWMQSWIRNSWRTSTKKPVKNQDLWKELKSVSDSLPVSWNWVRGHAGNELNELCDAMVQEEIRSKGL